jgi:zinc protease
MTALARHPLFHRAISVFIAVALWACAGPRTPDRTVQFQSTLYSSRLRNGLRVQVVEDHATNLVQLGVRFDVGSASDPPGKAGLAHLVEHLMFQIASRPDGRPIGAELSAIAIGFNAQTTWEATQYVSMARADQIGRLVEIEARRFSAGCETIAPGTFEREREVVRNELRLRRDLGDDLELLMEHIVPPGHPYARPVGGSDLEVSRLTLADVCAFMTAHYRPDRMIVVLTGDVAARPAIRMVARHMGALAGRSTGLRPVFPAIAPARRTFQGDLHLGTGPAVLVAWPLPADHGPERAAASIATLLLQAELAREQEGGVLVELGETRAHLAAALVRLPEGAAGPAAVDEALAAVQRAAARAARVRSRDVVGALAVRRARGVLADYDRLPSRVERLAEGVQRGAVDHVFTRQLQALDEVTPREVSRMAGKLFAGERAVVVAIEPAAARRGETAASALSYAGRSHNDAWTVPADPGEATEELRLPLPRSTLAKARRFRLRNGLDVILLRTPAAPLVSARMIFAGGSADDPPDKARLSELAACRLESRTLERSRSGLSSARRAVARTGDIDVQVEADRTLFSASGLSSQLDVVLAALASRVDGEYGDEGDDIDGRPCGTGLRSTPPEATEWDERRAWLRWSLHRSVYGASHPYTRAAHPRPAPARISRADLERVRARRFGGRNGVLVITGDFDPSFAREHAEHWFADLRHGERHTVARPPAAPRAARAVIERSGPAEPTAIIEIAFPTGKQPQLRAARMVIGRILGERMARVREVLGAAYSISAAHEDNAGPGMFLISATVDARRTDEALMTMLGELARLRAGEGPELAESFVRARRKVLYGLLAEESGADIAGADIAALLQHGETGLSHADLAREIMALTIQDLLPVLARDLAPEHESVGILGPERSVAAARRAAGI